MKSGVWFAAGAAAGVYGMVRVRRLAEAFTPDGMRDRIGAAFVGARMFREEVAQGQAEAETHLRARLQAADARHRELAAPSTPSITRTTGTTPIDSTSTRTITTAESAALDQEGSR
ncbi:hypothetical protein GCM10022237_49040 [Nocardioides ginsengisoli]|uniref:DUF6167 family protein n=1 Tax=Nocardioides ginsengisoli TaxID=363868 RepID=A0ABW3W3Y0_9ACTN